MKKQDLIKLIKECHDEILKEATQSYKDKVLAFIEHPWQEDLEIDFIDKISEYKDKILNSSDAKVKDYLKRFSDQLTGSMMARLSDKFMEDLDQLINEDALTEELEVKPPKEKLIKTTKLNPGDIINYGQYGQYKFEVVKDLGDEVEIININKNTNKRPFVRDKEAYKGSWVTRKSINEAEGYPNDYDAYETLSVPLAEDIETQTNYFTFGGYAGEDLRPYCVKIDGSSQSARSKMFKLFGPKWAFHYNDKPREKVIDIDKAKKLFDAWLNDNENTEY